jgi:hypothetical protein
MQAKLLQVMKAASYHCCTTVAHAFAITPPCCTASFENKTTSARIHTAMFHFSHRSADFFRRQRPRAYCRSQSDQVWLVDSSLQSTDKQTKAASHDCIACQTKHMQAGRLSSLSLVWVTQKGHRPQLLIDCAQVGCPIHKGHPPYDIYRYIPN